MASRKRMPAWFFLVVCALCGYVPVYALPHEFPPSGPTRMAEKTVIQADNGKDFTLRRLEKIQAETLLVEAQVARAKALQSLKDSGSSDSIAQVSDGMEINVSKATGQRGALPLIREIYGAGTRLVARLVLNDGSQAELTAGQQIPGTQLKISSISAREVRVSAPDGSGVQSLNFVGNSDGTGH
jgi:type IV pilus biogenesis protein PilP